MRVLSFSYCFPHAAAPTWGVFVERRLAALARRPGVDLQVVAPVPNFPLVTRWRRGVVPACEQWHGLTVYRPRFFCVPGVLKSLDAKLYARGVGKKLGAGSWKLEAGKVLTPMIDCASASQFPISDLPTPSSQLLAAGYRPDVLDAHFIWPDGVAVSLLARRLGLPYVITLRGKIYPCLEVPWQRRQCAEALRGAAAVMSVDERMAQIARELGAAPDRVSVVPNGVDLTRFRLADRYEARRQLGLPEQGRLLVTVAHLGVRKGHREAITALARLPEDVRLLLVGGGLTRGDANRLRRLAETLGVGQRLLLAGVQSADRVPDYFAAADVGLLASYREGCPNAVLECLACGRPVVATDVGAVPDLIEPGRNGQIVPVRDVEALTAALQKVLDRTWEPEEVRHSPAVRSWDDVAGEVQKVLVASS